MLACECSIDEAWLLNEELEKNKHRVAWEARQKKEFFQYPQPNGLCYSRGVVVGKPRHIKPNTTTEEFAKRLGVKWPRDKEPWEEGA